MQPVAPSLKAGLDNTGRRASSHPEPWDTLNGTVTILVLPRIHPWLYVLSAFVPQGHSSGRRKSSSSP